VRMLEQAGQLAAAHHAGLIDHKHRSVVELLPSSIQVAEEPVAGGHVLKSLPLQAQGGDPGRGGGQESVAVQLPGVAGDPEGEGLARPGPPHHQGDALTAPAQVSDYRLLVAAGSRMGGQGVTDGLMGGDRRLFLRPAGDDDDETLLDREKVGGRPAALLQGPVDDHADHLP
jgi:hypothetical protein